MFYQFPLIDIHESDDEKNFLKIIWTILYLNTVENIIITFYLLC